jgi:hypothetical protein
MDESLRMIERILATLLGGFFAWLGYRLFLDVTSKQTSSGEFKLPSGIAVHLTRVGPGIFFALFGAAVVCYSLYSRVTIDRTQTSSHKTRGSIVSNGARQQTGDSPDNAGEQKITKKFVGLTAQSEGSQQDLLRERNVRKNYIRFLNALSTHLETKGDNAELRDYKIILPQIKLIAMESIWDDKDWGSWTTFQDWVNTGAAEKEAPKNGYKEAYEYFGTK